jgi:hypothetical protein
MTTFKKIIETPPNWIDLSHLATWVMDSTRFNNFVVFVNYSILLYDKNKCSQNQAPNMK